MVAVEVDCCMDGEAPIPIEVIRTLHSLASSWSDVADSKVLEVVPLKGALTNRVYAIHWETDGAELPRKVLVRIYGEGVDLFFDRNVEIKTFEFMSKHGQGPRLLGRFPSGRVEEFIHARTLSAPDLRDPEISSLIAAKMREFHKLDMPVPQTPLLWERLRDWLDTAKRLCSSEEAAEFQLDTIDEEISILQKKLSGENQRLGFCHNDLQYANIMIDEETRAITTIDYEYACYNYIAYDIANHFCEMTADYHSEAPHLLDYNKYPDIEQRRRFVYNYLSSSGDEHSDDEVEQLIEDVEMFTIASHLSWGLWGIISDHVNEIDFNYMEYGRQRFQQYRLRMPALLASQNP